jgi:hypothetical protein
VVGTCFRDIFVRGIGFEFGWKFRVRVDGMSFIWER